MGWYFIVNSNNKTLKIMKKIIISSILCGFFTLGLYAQKATKKPIIPVKSPTKPVSKSLLAVSTAINLIRYGYDQKCATCLVSAADILSKNPISPLKFENKVEGKGVASSKTDKKATIDIKTLLSDAQAMDKSVEGMAKKIVIPVASRGAVGGSQYGTGRVNAKAEVYYDIKFYGLEQATVIVKGDGDTDLDVYVHDIYGNLVAKDDDATDGCVVSFIPKFTTTFKVYVTNRGKVYNNYELLTN
jgi:hypothetical protein